jgi:hypothetical protein
LRAAAKTPEQVASDQSTGASAPVFIASQRLAAPPGQRRRAAGAQHASPGKVQLAKVRGKKDTVASFSNPIRNNVQLVSSQ